MINEIYEKLTQLAEKTGYADSPGVHKKILQIALRGDKKAAEALEKKLLFYAEQNPNPFPKGTKNEFKGSIRLGETSFGYEVRSRPSDISHTLIDGETQSGKSVTMGSLNCQLNKNTSVATLTTDPKRSYRALARHLDNLYVVRLDKFPFNPFSAFKSNKKVWLQDFAGILAQTGDLMTGSRSFILDVLDSLMSHFESKNRPPTMLNFHKEINALKNKSRPNSKTHRYGETTENRVKALQYLFRDSFNYYYGFPLEKLIDGSINLVLEYDSIDPIYAKTLILWLIQSLYNYQLSEGNRGGDVDLMIFMDEAEEILGHGDTHLDLGLGTINKIFERSKELQIGLVASSHSTRINPVVRENVRARFCFNLSSAEDIRKVSRDLGLSEDQKDEISKLKPGEAVAKIKDQRDDPFKIKINPVKLDDVPDKEIKSKNRELWKKVKNEIIPREKEKEKSTREKKSKQEKIDKNSHVLLENIARFPYLSITERKDKLGWSNSRLSNTRKKLRSNGYTRNKRLKKPEGGRGSTLKLLEATGKALKYLREQGIKAKYIGRGGAVHSYYMQYCIDNLKRNNVDVSYETDLGGISVDLFIVKQSGKTQAIEIEVSSSENTLNKLKKLLEMVDRVLIVSDKKVLVDEFKQGIEEMNIDQDRVSVKKIQDIEF